MKVYIVMNQYDYEGYDTPDHCYYSKEKAIEKVNELNSAWHIGEYKWFEIEVE